MPIPAWGRDWWDHRQSPHGTWSRRKAQQIWAWTRADGDGEQSPSDLSSDTWPSHWPGREAGEVPAASNCSFSSLFFLNLSQRAPVFPSPQLHRGCGACGGWGTAGLLNIPSPSPGHGKTLLTQEHKLREMKQRQKINLFSTIFFFSFQPFWDLAHLLWDRRIRENHESSQKVFVHVKEEGGKQHQKKKEIKKAEKLFPFSTHSSGALGKNEHFSSHLVPLEEKSKCLSVLNACNYIHRKLRSKTK